MKINLKITRKNEDGSADAVVDYDDAGLQVIIQYGVIAILKEGIEDMENKNDKRSLQLNLEDSIEAFHSVIEDIKLLYKTHGDRKLPMSEDEIATALLGLESKSSMIAYWAVNAYEQYFKLNDYASKEAKARRDAIRDWTEE